MTFNLIGEVNKRQRMIVYFYITVLRLAYRVLLQRIQYI